MPIERNGMFGNRTVQQSNILEHQQSETRSSFIWSETKRCGQISYLLASISNTSITGRIPDRAEVKLTILEAVVNENEILLDNIDSTDVAEFDGLTGITADEVRSEQSEIILDEGDLRNC